MSKKRINISVDPDVHAKAKQLGLNVSGVAEHALRTYVQTLQHSDQYPSSPVITIPADSAGDESPTPNMTQHAESSVEEIPTDYENYARTVLNRDDTTLNQHRRYIGGSCATLKNHPTRSPKRTSSDTWSPNSL
ncbi:type II toxin-antitoxin system CcdA family antitoxin [Haloquadratum walsbyi]|nr:type II toxin-antitoxin system CcdA family antitoxin [Haloquadratum walsbyi]